MARSNVRLLLRTLEQRITPMAGQLDATFGVGGLASTRFPPVFSQTGYAQSTAIDGLGRIVLAGYVSNGSTNDFTVTRYTTDGALDVSFGGTGIVMIAFGAYDDQANGVAIDSMNRVVVAGFTYTGNGYSFAIARLTSSGMLDPNFDGDGKKTIEFGGGGEKAYGIAVDSLDRIVVVGSSFQVSDTDFAVARLTTDGALDTSFDGDGQKLIDFADDYLLGIAIDSQSRIVVAGYSNDGVDSDFAVARLTPSGALDVGFDADGKQIIDFGTANEVARSVAVDSLDRIILAGDAAIGSNADFAVARLTAAGGLDFSFDMDGKTTIVFGSFIDEAYGVTVDSGDRIVVVGATSNGSNYDFAVTRLAVTGALDTDFDNDGKQTFAFGASNEKAYCVASDPLDRIVIGGYTFAPGVAVARLTIAGALDSSFDSDGKLNHELSQTSIVGARSVAVDSMGRTVVAGAAYSPANHYDFTITRYTAVGILDTSFGGTGIVTIVFGPSEDFANGVAIDSQDRVVVAGYSLTGTGSTRHFAVARLTTTGILDLSFDIDGKLTFAFGSSSDSASDVAIDSLDRVVIAGTTSTVGKNDFAVARLNTDGAFDTGFDFDGKTTVDFASTSDSASSVAIDKLGRIVVAGNTNGGTTLTDFAIVRLTNAGTLDASFDGDGKQTIVFGVHNDIAYDVAVDSLHRAVVCGISVDNGIIRFAVARLTASGVIDTSWNGNGKQIINFHPPTIGRDTVASDVVVDSLNRIVVAGFSYNGSSYDFAVARLTANGLLDSSFDSDGQQTIAFDAFHDLATGVAIDSFGRVLVAGHADMSGPVFAVARLTSDTPPPKVNSIIINDDTAQRSIVSSIEVAFDSPVSFVGPPSNAFQLYRQSDNVLVTLSAFVDVSGTIVTLTFTGGAVDLGGSLADGRYTLKILSNQFSGLGFDGDSDGRAEMSPFDDYIHVGSLANHFFRLFGDNNGNGVVAADDFIQFRMALGGPSPIFDFDNDGAVAASDFIQFRLRFGGSI